tara:strand:- start:838 stop:1152 length:315 start_codon:yes stop_codon:yes gene_type:complete
MSGLADYFKTTVDQGKDALSGIEEFAGNKTVGQVSTDAMVLGGGGAALAALGVAELIPGLNVVASAALIAGGIGTVLYGAFHKEPKPVAPKLPDPIGVGNQIGV